MILIDMNQMTISHIMAESKGKPIFDENLIRHMIINDLRLIKSRYQDFGDVVLCYDSRRSWRSDVFPEYKKRRKNNRAESDFDWGALHILMDQIREDLTANFPYRVIKIDGCEADDVIATIAKEYSKTQKVLILSSDEDFIQLQAFPNIFQYGFSQKKMLTTSDAADYRIEHILRGDAGDDIPNVLSDNDVFVTEGKRQLPMTEKRMALFKTEIRTPDDLYNSDVLTRVEDKLRNVCLFTKENIIRNRKLIDLVVELPAHEEILAKYRSIIPLDRSRVLSYLIEHNMPLLAARISEF